MVRIYNDDKLYIIYTNTNDEILQPEAAYIRSCIQYNPLQNLANCLNQISRWNSIKGKQRRSRIHFPENFKNKEEQTKIEGLKRHSINHSCTTPAVRKDRRPVSALLFTFR